jgi:hypothetical protein
MSLAAAGENHQHVILALFDDNADLVHAIHVVFAARGWRNVRGSWVRTRRTLEFTVDDDIARR